MSIVDKLRGYIGIRNYLDKQNFQYNKEKELNILFLAFAKDMNWSKDFTKENSKNYKGKNKPFIYNGWLISCNFKEFKEWFKNYKTNNIELKTQQSV